MDYSICYNLLSSTNHTEDGSTTSTVSFVVQNSEEDDKDLPEAVAVPVTKSSLKKKIISSRNNDAQKKILEFVNITDKKVKVERLYELDYQSLKRINAHLNPRQSLPNKKAATLRLARLLI